MIGAIRTHARQLSTRFLIILAIALAAFAWQSFITQVHVHGAPQAASRTLAGAQLSRPAPPPNLPIDCPICHDAAVAGHYLSPGPVLVLAAIAGVDWRPVAGALHSAPLQRSHRWRSRAPPLRSA
ncbi:MAG: hypothetical protein ACTHMG_16375 [Sphingomonas sp.]